MFPNPLMAFFFARFLFIYLALISTTVKQLLFFFDLFSSREACLLSFFTFFSLLRVSQHFFLIVFDWKRRLFPSLQKKSVFSTFSSTTASFSFLLTPFFFAFMCETSSVKDRYRCMSQVFTQYILCEKKKSGLISYLAIFDTHALLVHILWQFWRWNAENGCPAHGSRSARECEKKRRSCQEHFFLYFFFGGFAVAES